MRQIYGGMTAATLAALHLLGATTGGKVIAEEAAASLDDQVPVILLADEPQLGARDDGAGDSPAAVIDEITSSDSPIENETIPQLNESSLTQTEREIEAQEMVRRMARHEHGMQSLVSARLAMEERRFEEAIHMYRQAIDHIVPRDDTRVFRREAESSLTEAYYRYAVQLDSQEAYEKALEQCGLALNRDHPQSKELMALIRDHMKPKEEPPLPHTPRRNEKTYQAVAEEVEGFLLAAREHFEVGEYSEAKSKVESALKRDPENLQAIWLRDKIGNMRLDRASMELESTRRNMIADVRRTWNSRHYGMDEGRNKRDPITRTRKRTVVAEEENRRKMLSRMERIIIPEIDFHDADINDVIDFIQEASIDNDREYNPEVDRKQGVDIILDLGEDPGSAAGADAAPDPFASDTGLDEGFGATPSRRVTFKARYISLLEALNIVTDLANLKYFVRGQVIMVVPVDAPTTDIITQTYPVLPNVNNRILEFRKASDGGGDFASLDTEIVMSEGGGATDWQKFFEQMGVSWPRGSRVSYLSELGRLVVANTLENHEKLEQVLNIINITPRQIEIEARFVEVQQTDEDALGFEWLLNDDWEVAQRAGQGAMPVANQQRVVIGAGSFTPGLRFANSLDETTSNINDSVLRIGGVLTNPELSMVLHALRRRKNADLLSAPKVTTQSGLEATIKVVTEYIYPTEFDVQEIQGVITDDRGNTQTVPVGAIVEPSGFEKREVGVLLTVIPEVSQEGQMIRLTLGPEVVGEPTWRNYGSTYQTFSGDNTSGNALPMEQPFFPVRSVQTTITIYNNATVLMGGMITEDRFEVDDSIPLLGDIPIIGRLFRSRADKSSKRNLLIFVTARMVDPEGRPLQEDNFDQLVRAIGDETTPSPVE